VPDAGAQAPTGTVNVVLTEWAIKPTPKTVTAGSMTFVVKNQGGTKHELLIVRGDDPKALPKKSNGSVNEAKLPDGAIVGSIEGVKSQATKSATFELTAGTYVLICNIVDPAGRYCRRSTATTRAGTATTAIEHGDHGQPLLKMYTVFGD
jgi:uncharacterized cupredoxin-like copper-binding protein